MARPISLWDSMPLYFSLQEVQAERIPSGAIDTVKRTFDCHGLVATVEIHPATILLPDGQTMYCLPGEEERQLELALRQIALRHDPRFFDGSAASDSILVAPYDLRAQMRQLGWDLDYGEIIKRLKILISTSLKVCFPFGENTLFLSSTYLRLLSWIREADCSPGRQMVPAWEITFHPLAVTTLSEIQAQTGVGSPSSSRLH